MRTQACVADRLEKLEDQNTARMRILVFSFFLKKTLTLPQSTERLQTNKDLLTKIYVMLFFPHSLIYLFNLQMPSHSLV